jgi:hypothetical protein
MTVRPVRYRWVDRVSSSGRPYRAVEKVSMPFGLTEAFLKTVVYLYYSDAEAKWGAHRGATAFLAGVPSAVGNAHHPYVVTNAHALDKNGVVIRINKPSGGFDTISVAYDEWIRHPHGDDVAVYPIELNRRDHAVEVIPISWFLPREGHPFRVGDDCLIIGRQINLEGKRSNTPAARFGAISMMNPEPINQDIRHFDQESIAVEARSLGGFSGAPVFAYRTASLSTPTLREDVPQPGSDIPLLNAGDLVHGEWPIVVSPLIEGPLCLLGMNWGHMGSRKAIVGEGSLAKLSKANRELALNSGMLLLVPAWRITELLMTRELVELREKDDAEIAQREAESAAVMDSINESDPATPDMDERFSLHPMSPEQALRRLFGNSSPDEES